MTNDNITATLESLAEWNADAGRKAWEVYRETIAQVASGAIIRPETLHRSITAAGRTVDDFRSDVARAGLIAECAAATVAAAEIDAKSRPLADEWRKAKAEFDEIAKSHREKSQRLEMQIQSIRMPLRDHETLRQRLQTTEQEMPDSIRAVVRGWANEVESLRALHKSATRESFAPNDEHGNPASPERIAAYERDLARRNAEADRLEKRINVLERASAIVRATALDAVTGLWDPFADVSACLTSAQQEADAAESARLAPENVQIEETADQATEESE